MSLKIEPFDRSKHIRTHFCSKEDSLDNYLQTQASQDLKRKITAIFVLIEDDNPEILAYYTLSAYTVEIQQLDRSFAKQLPRYPQLPATLLGRLAVDHQHQGNKFGELMLIDALKRAYQTSQQVASLVVIAEALNEKAAQFYQKYRFQAFKENPLKLYLPLKSVQTLI